MPGKRVMVVIGGVAAGMSAAARARRRDPDLEIVVYERSGYVSYGACGFPYFVKGMVGAMDDLIARSPERFARDRIGVHLRHEVRAIDTGARTIEVCDLASGRVLTREYDDLVIATGASAQTRGLAGASLPGVFTLRTPEDALGLRRWLEEERPEAAVIVGGGYVGLEMAEGLAPHVRRLSLLHSGGEVMEGVFDSELAALLHEEVERQGVDLRLGTEVSGLGGDGRVEWVEGGGERVPAGLVVLAAGIAPAADLARAAGVPLGRTGAIAVDDRQRTRVERVWAAGDAAEARHVVTGEQVWIPLGTTANKQGRVAGDNVAGGDSRFQGIAGTAVLKVFDLEAARTGLSLAQASAAGLDAGEATIRARTRAAYYPGARPITVRLVHERSSRRLLGGQIVGGEGAAKRIDVVAAALHAGWSASDLAEVDMSYAPPFAPVWDPLLIAANAAAR
jgi:NADPH-dependent 2,4-dienoyl-CoA reductase/sulfur reductase-like enzyme